MESTTQEKKETAPTEAPVVEQKPSEVKEEYKDLGEYEARITPAIVDKKNVPVASYGHRMRIAKLYSCTIPTRSLCTKSLLWPDGQRLCAPEARTSASSRSVTALPSRGCR